MNQAINLFEIASRQKFRFDTPKGLLSVEDLWELPLTSANAGRANLDDIAKALHREIRESDSAVSFVKPTEVNTTILQTKFEIVKYIIDVRVTERDAQAQAADRAARKQQLLAILERRENAELESKSPEEIRAMIAAM